MPIIDRDAGSPFDPNAPVPDPDLPGGPHLMIAEFEGFASDVPRTDGMIAAVQGLAVPGNTRANRLRAAKLFVPELVATLPPAQPFPTPDRVLANEQGVPASAFERQGLHGVDLLVPLVGGGTMAVDMWSFQDNLANPKVGGWPGPLIRVREGRLVHSSLKSATGPHTIHHHGIEPTAMNDGVGHLTFEVGAESYAYQWQAGEAGTFFYHCHRNTVLHFERGMYGALIIDPDVAGAPFQLGGEGVCWVENALVPYAAEALWVADDIDTRWHGMANNPTPRNLPPIDHVSDGIQRLDADARSGFMSIDDPANPKLHDFNPNVFVVTGRAVPYDPSLGRSVNGATITDGGLVSTPITPRVEISHAETRHLLVRTLNASYAHTRWRFPPAVQGRVIAADGRTFGRAPFGSYSRPLTLAGMNHEFALSTARRWDVLLDIDHSTPIGTHTVECTFHHWITDVPLCTVKLEFVVA